MKGLLLGVDIGTGGCKTTLIDEDGAFIADGYTEYPTAHPHAGWSEQDPEDWLPAMVRSLRTALERAGRDAKEVVGLAVDSSAHNAVLLDRDDQILRKTIMWTDQRSAAESDFLVREYREPIFAASYNVPTPTWTLPQLMWIAKNEPGTFARIHRILFINDYVRFRLTGQWKTDHIQAQGSILFDNRTWRWSEEICRLGGIPLDALPPVCRPTDVDGHLTRSAAALTGMREGVPVIVGSSDTALENYSVGAIRQGDCVVKMATAGTVNIFQAKPFPNPQSFTYSHVVDGLWYNCSGTNSAAHSLRWYRDVFCREELRQERAGGEDVYALLDREAEPVPPGADGLFFHPYLSGERAPYWDPRLRGSFVGMTALHTRGHFNRAVLEGVAYSLKQNFHIMESLCDIGEVKFVGGGAKSPLWRQILANMLNRNILKYQKDDSSLGSALLCGVAVGAFADHEDAIARGARLSGRTLPEPETAALYSRLYPLYLEIHDDLAETYHKYC